MSDDHYFFECGKLQDELDSARAALKGLAGVLENYQSFPIVSRALKQHATEIAKCSNA